MKPLGVKKTIYLFIYLGHQCRSLTPKFNLIVALNVKFHSQSGARATHDR